MFCTAGVYLKTVILAAGPGRRFGNLTKYIPKPLLPVANRPVIKRLLKTLENVGIKETIIVVGHLGDKIIKEINASENLNLQIRYIKANQYTKGPIFSFLSTINELLGEDFILCPADCLVSPHTIKKLLEDAKNKTTLVACEHTKKGASIFIGNDLEVKGLITPVKKWTRTAKSMGIMYVTSEFLKYVEKAVEKGKTKITDAINIAIKEGMEIKAIYVRDQNWFDIDNISILLEANKHYLEKLLHIDRKWGIPDVKIFHPVLLGDEVHIEENCEIGPYVSIDKKVQIGEKCKLKNAIVLKESKIPPRSILFDGIFYKDTFYRKKRGTYV